MLPNRGSEEAGAPHSTLTETTALVAQTPPQRAFLTRGPRNDAAFITHLIATAEQAPQTRNLRRASLQDAMTGYHVTMQAAGPARPRVTSRLA
jgi:hypothetical protein